MIKLRKDDFYTLSPSFTMIIFFRKSNNLYNEANKLTLYWRETTMKNITKTVGKILAIGIKVFWLWFFGSIVIDFIGNAINIVRCKYKEMDPPYPQTCKELYQEMKSPMATLISRSKAGWKWYFNDACGNISFK